MSARRPTKQERREEARRERAELARRKARHDLYRRVWMFIGLLAGVTAIGAFFLLGGEEDTGPARPPRGVQDFEVASRSHVDGPLQYPQDPPVGGDHASQWITCDVYDQPIPTENAVHSLEHGAVWITYSPDVPPDQARALADLAGGGYVIVSPYLTLDVPVAASSWGHQLRVESPNDPRLEEFVRAFAQGPDTPELGAPCTGGLTLPEGS